jgi:hypothetical protein
MGLCSGSRIPRRNQNQANVNVQCRAVFLINQHFLEFLYIYKINK